MKKIVIIGGSGFIGANLKTVLNDFDIKSIKGREVNSYSPEFLALAFADAEIIINLSGQSIMGYWTKAYKNKLYESRVSLTQKIGQAIETMDIKPKAYLSASAVGIYADGQDVTEGSNHYANNYLADLVLDWEKSALGIEKHGLKVTILRFGIILGKRGGAYPILRKLVKFNVGAIMGQGKQSYSFIYINDAVRAIRFIIDKKISGIVNMVSPKYTTNKDLMLSLKQYFKSWIVWYIPAWLLKIILAEASVVYLEGQRVIPDVLLKNNFRFEVDSIDACIDKIEGS